MHSVLQSYRPGTNPFFARKGIRSRPSREPEEAVAFRQNHLVVAVTDFCKRSQKTGCSGAVPQLGGKRDDGRLVHVLTLGEGMDEHVYEAGHLFHGRKGIPGFSFLQILASLAKTRGTPLPKPSAPPPCMRCPFPSGWRTSWRPGPRRPR